MAAAHGLAKAFPLLQQDPVLFGERPGQGRLLHRRSFAPFLPPFLRDNPTKDREPEGGLEAWRAELVNQRREVLAGALEASTSWHPALAQWWDLGAIHRETEAILARPQPTMKQVIGTSRAFATLATLSDWWRALEG
jgi:hypothetical protein